METLDVYQLAEIREWFAQVPSTDNDTIRDYLFHEGGMDVETASYLLLRGKRFEEICDLCKDQLFPVVGAYRATHELMISLCMELKWSLGSGMFEDALRTAYGNLVSEDDAKGYELSFLDSFTDVVLAERLLAGLFE